MFRVKENNRSLENFLASYFEVSLEKVVYPLPSQAMLFKHSIEGFHLPFVFLVCT